MTEEIQGTIVSLSFKTFEFSIDFFEKVIEKVANLIGSKDQLKHGKQTLSSLNKHNSSLENIDITKTDLSSLKKELKKTGVDFAIIKDKSTNEYKVFFKGKDIEQIKLCLKNHVVNRENSLNHKLKVAQKQSDEFNLFNDGKEKNMSQNVTI